MKYWHHLDKKLDNSLITGEYRDLFINRFSDNLLNIADNYLNFSSNDYFSLANSSDTKEKALRISKNLPLGGAGSRLASPESFLYNKLENLIAHIKNTPAAIVTGSGYLNSIALLQAITTENNLILMDRNIHASWIDAIFTIKSLRFLRYKHNDVKHLESLLNENASKYDQIFILTETVFSMHGTVSDIKKLLKIARKHQAILIEDDAHGLGLVNTDKWRELDSINKMEKNVSNINSEEIEYYSEYHIKTGTLSKSVGSYGGYIAASDIVIKAIINFARPVIFSTSLPPFVLAASYLNLKKILAERVAYNDFLKNKTVNIDNNFIYKLFNNINYLKSNSSIKLTNFNNHIFIMHINCPKKTIDLQKFLFSKKMLVSAIRFPAIQRGSELIRISISSSMSFKEIDMLLLALEACKL